MSTINVCDRCGAFGKDEIMGQIDIVYGPAEMKSTKARDLEICSTCLVELDLWLTHGNMLRSGIPVTEKYMATPEVSDETRALARVVAEEFARARDTANKAITS